MTTSTISTRSSRPWLVGGRVTSSVAMPRLRVGIDGSRLECRLGFIVPLAVYLWVGWRLGMDAHLLPGDSLARVANASATLFSRDPHPEAIGFVWSPFPSLLEVPLVWLSRFWAPLLTRGMAGVIISSLAMAGAVATVRAWLADLGLGAWVRWGIVVVFAFNPFTLLYGANGMSEAGLICFCVIAARRFALWLEDDRPGDLVAAGLAVSVAYLFRYEAAAAIGAFGLAAAWIGWRRASGDTRTRVRRGLLRLAVAAMPGVFTAAVWALVSWAVVGEPFAQFSSQYGNSTQVASTVRAAHGAARALLFAKQLAAYGSPAIVCVVVLVFFGTDIANRTTAALALVGAPLAFQFASAAQGSTFDFSRYVIMAVPLGALLAGVVAAKAPSSAVGARVVCLAVVIGLTAALVPAVGTMRDGSLSSVEEQGELSALPGSIAPAPAAVPPIIGGERVARAIDARHPAHGQVLTDSATTFTVLLNAKDQRDYVIPADRDSQRILADPSRFGVRYILVGQPTSAFDSVAAAWPGMFANGGGLAHLVGEWGSSADAKTHFRLYELNRWRRR